MPAWRARTPPPFVRDDREDFILVIRSRSRRPDRREAFVLPERRVTFHSGGVIYAFGFAPEGVDVMERVSVGEERLRFVARLLSGEGMSARKNRHRSRLPSFNIRVRFSSACLNAGKSPSTVFQTSSGSTPKYW